MFTAALREKLADLKVHDWATMMHLRRKAYAASLEKAGVNITEEDIPLPGTRTEINQQGTGAVKTLLAASAIAAAILGGAKWMQMSGQPAKESTRPAVGVSVPDKQVKVELFYDDGEGKLVPIPGAATPGGAKVPLEPKAIP